MTGLKITTVNTFDEQGIFPLRTLRVGNKTVRTPAAAIQPGKLREHEDVHPESRGVNELYRTVDGATLDEAMKQPEGGALNEALQRQYAKTEDDELTITFTKYDETQTLGPAHAQYLAHLHANYSDVITVPLLPQLIQNVVPDEGVANASYRSFKKSVVAFLNQVADHESNKPVMGLIPRLGWEFTEDLLEVYEAHDVRAYVFDFDRRKITTGTQVAMIEPLMQSIANRGIEEHVLFYAINPSPGIVDHSIGARPAADIASIGLGFDIIGGLHVSPRLPQEVFERMEAEQSDEDGEHDFRLFDKEEWLYRDVPLSNLPDLFPSESSFDASQVVRRVEASPTNAKYRLQHLVNGEQMALAASSLREELEMGDAYSNIVTKPGVTNQVTSAYDRVRSSFDEERLQSGFGDFE